MVSIGLFSLMGFRDRGTPVAEVVRETVSLVRQADEAGFDAAWFPEHHFSNYSICPSPLLMVSHCAGATARIKLGPAVVVVPLYNPVRLLAEIGLVAALCGDRFQLGIGSGYQPFEFNRYGADLGESKDRLDEFLALMDRSFGSETFTFDGRFTTVPPASISTRPTLGPPPIWIAGDSEATHRLAARRGFTPFITGRGQGAGYLAEQRARIEAAFAKEGREGALKLGVLRFCCVTESRAETEAYLIAARHQLRLASALRNQKQDMDGGMLIERPVEGEVSLEDMARNLPVGDVETVTTRLIADLKASKASHVMLNIPTLGSTVAQAQRTIDLVARDIGPALQQATP